MITFARVSARPSALASLSGLNLADFEALYQDFAAHYVQDRKNSLTRKGQPRKRAAGAGAKFSQDGRTRLLMALVWLLTYPTYEVLAFLFSLNKGNAQRGVVGVLAPLEAHTVFVYERPAQERQKMCSVQAVMDAFPDVRLVIDAKEQRIQRPGGSDDSMATAINRPSVVVGWATTSPDSLMHAVLWHGKAIQDLNDEIRTVPRIILSNAKGINNHGQIICDGFPADAGNNEHQHAYLLIPH